jgi:hypothetical protein
MPALYPPTSSETRNALLNFIQTTPFAYGTWGEWKRLYKEIEADKANADSEVLGALLARLDNAALEENGTIQPVVLGVEGTVKKSHTNDDLLFVLIDKHSQYNYDKGRHEESGEPAAAIYREDPAKPLNPVFLSKIPGKYDYVARQGNILFLLNNNNIKLYNINEPENPKLLGKHTIARSARNVVFKNNHVLVVQNGGIEVLTVEDPANILSLGGGFSLKDIQEEIVLHEKNEIALVRTRTNNWPYRGDVHVLDIRDLKNIKNIAKINVINPITMAFDGDRVLIVEQDKEYKYNLRMFDIAGILAEKKTLLGVIPLPSGGVRTLGSLDLNNWVQPQQILVRDGKALLSNSGVLVDISDPMRLKQIGTFATPSNLTLSQNRRVYSTGREYSKGNVLHVWQLQNDLKLQRIGTPPSMDTMGYMKRRARRVLRSLDGAKFAEVATHMLTRVPEITPQAQWISMDVLYGGSKRWEQMSHGRKGYKAIGKEPMGRRMGEEKFAERWATETAVAAATKLLKTSGLAWQIYALALRVMLKNKKSAPTMAEDVLKLCLNSSSLPLIAEASRQVAQIIAGKGKLSGDVVALGLYKSITDQRRTLRNTLEPQIKDKDKKWQKAFAEKLLELVNDAIEENYDSEKEENAPLNKRQIDSLSLLGKHFADYIDADQIVENIPALLSSGDETLIALVVGAARTVTSDWEDWLAPLALVTAAQREPVMLVLENGIKSHKLNRSELYWLVWYMDTAEEARLGWRLVAAAQTKPEEVKMLWLQLLNETTATERLRGTMTSSHALALLGYAGITNEELAEKLRARPFLMGLLTEDAFSRLIATSPMDLLLSLSALAPEENWPALKSGWLKNLQALPLWQALDKAFSGQDGGILAARFAEDDAFITTLLELDRANAEAILGFSAIEMEPLVEAWCRKNETVFVKDSAPLLLASTHTFPAVRRFGLAKVASLGMGLPFALRLLESEMPESVSVGWGFFTAIPNGHDQEVTYALSLCDSPAATVRKMGRQFVLVRWSHLPKEQVLSALFENPDPETQALVTQLLSGTDVKPAESAAFEGEVLRQKNRARKAKEIVKVRQDKESVVDTPTLLALARGSRTPRDADWALAQLAKRAMAGETIEGLEVVR